MNNEEHQIQSEAVRQARLRWPICRTMLRANPNGGKRHARVGAMLKAEGVLTGTWDLFLSVTKFGGDFEGMTTYTKIGLWIEVKRPMYRTHKRGGLTVEQEAFGIEVQRQGYETQVCYSTQEILNTIDEYLRG